MEQKSVILGNFGCIINRAQNSDLPEGEKVFHRANADVAQLVEQRFRKPQVTGSNPVVGSSLHSRQPGSEKCHAVAPTEANRLIPGNSYRELRLGRHSIANCWSPTIER